MKLPDNYTVLFKNVKNVGIRVSQDGVRIVAPRGIHEEHLAHILEQREEWIRRHLRRFHARKRPEPLAADQILLKGRIYRIENDPSSRQGMNIDDDAGTVRTGVRLQQPEMQIRWYKTIARDHFERRVRELSRQHGFEYNRISIRNQKTRWGSCSRRKDLSLNWRLIKAPVFVIDYLLLHELVHTEIMNHSRQYWQRVESIFPEYKSAVRWLKEHGRDL